MNTNHIWAYVILFGPFFIVGALQAVGDRLNKREREGRK